MVKHPTSSRVHRDAEVEDAFVARVVEYSEWARRNTRLITIAAIVLFLGAAAALYWYNYRQRLESQAVAELTEIQQTAMSGNTALALQDLDSFLRDFSGTSPEPEARLMLGQLYLEEGRFREALEAVEPLARDLDDPMGTPAAFLRAAAYEGMEQPSQAEQVYLAIAEDSPLRFQQQRALADAARIRMARGEAAGAAELYRRIMEGLEAGDPERGVYSMRLAEAETAASAGSAASPEG